MKTFHDYETLCEAIGVQPVTENKEEHSKELKSRITWEKLDNGEFIVTSYTPKFERVTEHILKINHMDRDSEVMFLKGVSFGDFLKAGYKVKELF